MIFLSKNKIKRIIKKLLFVIPNLIGIILAPFLIIFIRSFKPIILIRYALIQSSRVGHFIGNIDTYLSYKFKGMQDNDLEKKFKIIHIFYLQEDVCNKEILKKIRKKLIILPRFILHWVEQFDVLLDRFIKSNRIHEIGCFDSDGGKMTHFSNNVPYIERDFNGYYKDNQNFFLVKEVDKGDKILKEIGVEKDKKVVCIYARDAAYLNQVYSDNDWSRHNYRNFDIENFNDTISYLIDRDYFVIRAGSLAEKKSKLINKNFLDYPFSDIQSDFFDIYIANRCNFLISTSSGIDDIFQAFRKPILWPLLFPIKDIKSSCHYHMAGFRHLENKNKRKLTFKEILDQGLEYCYKSSLLEKNNLYLSKPNTIDLMETTKDMIDYLNNRYELNEREKYLKERFFKIFENSSHFCEKQRFHKKINFQVSRYFLNNNEWWLD